MFARLVDFALDLEWFSIFGFCYASYFELCDFAMPRKHLKLSKPCFCDNCHSDNPPPLINGLKN
ncbi:hypothetical protein CQA40_02455 [Helicobacter sp. MIT 01-3238]|nr:hypothetical protein CQA40_02455 [Helicobacter sp. MIT 01-3238]